MVLKDVARQVINSLPYDVSMDDIIHALYVETKFAHSEREIRAGKGISHEETELTLQKWLK